MLHKFINTKD